MQGGIRTRKTLFLRQGCLPLHHLHIWRSESDSNAQAHFCAASLAGRCLTIRQSLRMETPARFERAYNRFAVCCLASWLRSRKRRGKDSNLQQPGQSRRCCRYTTPICNPCGARTRISALKGRRPSRLDEGITVCRTGYETPVRTMIASNVVSKTAANTTKLSKVGIAAPRCHL